MPVPLAQLGVQLIGAMEFRPPAIGGLDGTRWTIPDDVEGGCGAAEFAGRTCYGSFGRPNKATATNDGYLGHIIEVGHYSVLEHGVVSLYITGVSRSLTHELIRHRHLSPSQLSQRYVDAADTAFVMPPEIVGNPVLEEKFHAACEAALAHYEDLRDALDVELADVPDRTARRKRSRQAARSVLPNSVATEIVLTGNYRAWRHFIRMRASAAADVEIRALAIAVLDLLQRHAPNAFSDFTIVEQADGTRTAWTSAHE